MKYAFIICLKDCRMSNCFNFDLCDEFNVHIYDFDAPASGFEQIEPSDIYAKVLKSIKESRFYTNDPKRACLKILGKDFHVIMTRVIHGFQDFFLRNIARVC